MPPPAAKSSAAPDIAEVRAARRAAAIASFKTSQTLFGHWSGGFAPSDQTPFEPPPNWRERARAAAALIPAGLRVLDLGCGDMQLEALLPAGCVYLPLDVVARDARTLVVDLNSQPLPEVQADLVVGLGILEYLFDIPEVLRQLAARVPRALFSYHPMNQSPARDRLAMCWVNALNLPELMALFKYAGWGEATVHQYKPTVVIIEASRPG